MEGNISTSYKSQFDTFIKIINQIIINNKVRVLTFRK